MRWIGNIYNRLYVMAFPGLVVIRARMGRDSSANFSPSLKGRGRGFVFVFLGRARQSLTSGRPSTARTSLMICNTRWR
jgi:hypothetical protein